MKNELVDLELKILHETDAAILVEKDEEEKVWLPKSMAQDNGDGTITLPEWLAQEKELI